VHRVLDAQLGTKWRSTVFRFDDTAVASASIGQCTKALVQMARELPSRSSTPPALSEASIRFESLAAHGRSVKQLSPGVDVEVSFDD